MRGCICHYCGNVIREGDQAYSKYGEIGIYCTIGCLALAKKPRVEAYTLTEEMAEIKGGCLMEIDSNKKKEENSESC